MYNILYKVEIQMTMADKMTASLLVWVEQMLQAHNCCVEERDDYHAEISFISNIKPSEMRRLVKRCFQYGKRLYYIDTIYRYETEINADRFVYWGDGREQEYTGTMMFEEDK